jgi:nicotinamide phosphoribosyltransferase
MNPLFETDGYKLDHRRQYPKGTEYVYSNWTARGSRIEGIDHVTFVGLQMALKKRFMESFQKDFFDRDATEVVEEYATMLENYLGPEAAAQIGVEHIRALHELGYLPLEFKALPEGTKVPLRVPMITVENTHPDFFWLTNYVETILSAELWLTMTSATTAGEIRKILDSWAIKTTGSTEGVGFQGHDFSMRGMSGLDSAISSAIGHLVHFTGTETVPVLSALPEFYPVEGFLAATVPATEHSVMCAGGEDDEMETYQRLLDLYPNGILSVVSDTWDYWNVLTNILPALKHQIMARDGKLVVRPDSGDPADIICGTEREFGVGTTPEQKGSFEVLWELFGGEVNELGYKVLDSHIGLIYGDSMNPDRIKDICERLAAKGFVTTGWVAGIGSYNYQYQTRDTFMFAMKATNVTIEGEERAIHKNPKTDSGMKRSLKGRIAVAKDAVGNLAALDDENAEVRDTVIAAGEDQLVPVWRDGKFLREYTFDEVRANAGFGG